MIFVSYVRADEQFVLQMAKELASAGADVWVDQLRLRPGTRWDRAIHKALEECSDLLIVLSPLSIESDNVMDELAFALDERKQVVPVMLQPCSLPYRLRRFQYIDVRGDRKAAMTQLLQVFQLSRDGQLSSASEDARRANLHMASPKSLFPVKGVTLGKTSVQELALLGKQNLRFIEKTTGEPSPFYIVDHIDVWYDPHTAVATHIFLSTNEDVPSEWEALGFSWNQSYEGCMALLPHLGFLVVKVELPTNTVQERQPFFRATVTAIQSGDINYKLELKFRGEVETAKRLDDLAVSVA